MTPWLTLIAGLVIGAVVAWLWTGARAAARLTAAEAGAEGRLKGAEGVIAELRSQTQEIPLLRDKVQSGETARVAAETRLEQAEAGLAEQRRLLGEAEVRLADTFGALAAEALKGNDQHFIALAKTTFETIQAQAKGELEARRQEIGAMVNPLKESLDRYEQQIREMEKARLTAYVSLEEQLGSLSVINQQLQRETGSLANALRGGPQARGRWGEMTLRRAAELAGMAEHCDFDEQESFTTETGRLRPDMVVNLPGCRRIAVDAKAPLESFLQAAAATSDAERVAALARHGQRVRDHMNKLASKSYWDQFEQNPEFVVLFLPGESFFSAALEQDHELMEDGMKKRVVLATPTTLVSLLKAAAYGWRQESIEQNARAISDLGKQFYDRLRVYLEHFNRVGASLGRAVTAYNEAAGSLESRVLTPARKFKELGAATGADLGASHPVEAIPREILAPDRNGGDSSDGT